MGHSSAVLRTLATTSLALGLAGPAACGGSVVESGDGGGGSIATCGESCSAGAIQSACQQSCSALQQAGCLQGETYDDCASHCSSASTSIPGCAGAEADYLRCTQGVTPTCPQGMPVFAGCDAQLQALETCAGQTQGASGSGGSGTGTATGCTLAANQCPAIPMPTGTAACSAGGGGGPGGPSTSMYQCQSSSGHTWSASCSNGTCTCSYDGVGMCTCDQAMGAGSCGSCCPGAG